MYILNFNKYSIPIILNDFQSTINAIIISYMYICCVWMHAFVYAPVYVCMQLCACVFMHVPVCSHTNTHEFFNGKWLSLFSKIKQLPTVT